MVLLERRKVPVLTVAALQKGIWLYIDIYILWPDIQGWARKVALVYLVTKFMKPPELLANCHRHRK